MNIILPNYLRPMLSVGKASKASCPLQSVLLDICGTFGPDESMEQRGDGRRAGRCVYPPMWPKSVREVEKQATGEVVMVSRICNEKL